jgi:hypothetical protein
MEPAESVRPWLAAWHRQCDRAGRPVAAARGCTVARTCPRPAMLLWGAGQIEEVYRVRLPANPFSGRGVIIGEGRAGQSRVAGFPPRASDPAACGAPGTPLGQLGAEPAHGRYLPGGNTALRGMPHVGSYFQRAGGACFSDQPAWAWPSPTDAHRPRCCALAAGEPEPRHHLLRGRSCPDCGHESGTAQSHQPAPSLLLVLLLDPPAPLCRTTRCQRH